MKLLVISFKACWSIRIKNSVKYISTGGFPYQLRSIANLFDATKAILIQSRMPAGSGTTELTAQGLTIDLLPEPQGKDLLRKLNMLMWAPRHIRFLWYEISKSDAVHIPLPGDVGFLGLLLAMLQRKPIFVRHCGTWGEPVTFADHVLHWLLERMANDRNIVMATGGGDLPPSPVNSHISWIHATTLTKADFDKIPEKVPWRGGSTLHLVSVSRLSSGKNTIDIISALPSIQSHYTDTVLHIVGDGPERRHLKKYASELGLSEKVFFHGNVNHKEVLHILQQCDIFVFPTKTREGFPKAVLEALACGLPVVATAVSVLPFIIGSENGMILQNPTPETVTEAVLKIIADEYRYAAMCASAQKTSRQYTLERWQSIIKHRLEEKWGPLQGPYG